MIATLELAHPAALGLLLVPLVVLWYVARALARPRPDATGALEIWKRSAPEAPRSSSARTIPPAVWLLAAALACAAVAIAGPRAGGNPPSRSLLVVVDRSPSMYLASGGTTRFERALALTREHLARLGGEEVRWIAPPTFGDEARAPRDCPLAWSTAPREGALEPAFDLYDRPDTLWLTDRAPTPLPRRAGVCASGGEAVPGPIGVSDGRVVAWDGERLVAGDARARDRIALDRGLPARVTRFARVWAAARGLDVVDAEAADGEDTALVVRQAADGVVQSGTVARDGWSARATWRAPIVLDAPEGRLVAWLSARDGPVVAFGSRRIVVALESIDEPSGDPAAFPVSWSALFDAALAPPAGCVPLAERRAAGDPFVRAPARDRGENDVRASLGTALAAAAGVVCALAALGLAARAARRSMSAEGAR